MQGLGRERVSTVEDVRAMIEGMIGGWRTDGVGAFVIETASSDRRVVGQAGLMKHSGLSRSSVKRAMKDLQASKLLVLVDQGGVTPDGQNECNVYQLMVPTDPNRPNLRMTSTPSAHS